ncbi:MAG: SPOR domain-containing protein [Flavobacteriales bacterium]|nr:MAG: SPOR domain-containing protein [Flavobacteriales bacterium]
MTNFDKVLFDLLVHHNCVIIPEFGGFIAKRVSSQIDYEKGIISPPSKHLLFNRFLTADDGLLISSFVQSEGEDYDAVKTKISNVVSVLDKKLSNGEELTFKHIGTLKRSENGNYVFKQDRTFNMLADAYGLTDLDFVSAKEVKEEILEEESILISDNNHIEPVSENKNRTIGVKKILRYAAVACILPLAFYSFWIPFKSDFFSSGLISVDDLNPFYTKEAGKYEPKPSKHIITVENKSTLSHKEIQDDEVVKVEERVAPKDEAIVVETNLSISGVSSGVSKKAPYGKQYIVGCFAVKENAVNYKNKIEEDGFSPTISKSGRLYRVSMGITYSKEEYNLLIAKVISKGYKGWTLKK